MKGKFVKRIEDTRFLSLMESMLQKRCSRSLKSTLKS